MERYEKRKNYFDDDCYKYNGWYVLIRFIPGTHSQIVTTMIPKLKQCSMQIFIHVIRAIDVTFEMSLFSS